MQLFWITLNLIYFILLKYTDYCTFQIHLLWSKPSLVKFHAFYGLVFQPCHSFCQFITLLGTRFHLVLHVWQGPQSVKLWRNGIVLLLLPTQSQSFQYIEREGLTLFSVGYFLRTESICAPQCIFGNFFRSPPQITCFCYLFYWLNGVLWHL